MLETTVPAVPAVPSVQFDAAGGGGQGRRSGKARRAQERDSGNVSLHPRQARRRRRGAGAGQRVWRRERVSNSNGSILGAPLKGLSIDIAMSNG